MKYRIEKGSLKMMIFMQTGFFLIILFSYQLYNYIQTNEFVYEFPGDWDKPIGILVGIFLLFRSLSFISESKDLFIKFSESHLTFRTKRSDSIQKIALLNIEKIKEKDEKFILITKDFSELTIIDFNKVRLRDNVQKSIKSSLIKLNKSLTPTQKK